MLTRSVAWTRARQNSFLLVRGTVLARLVPMISNHQEGISPGPQGPFLPGAPQSDDNAPPESYSFWRPPVCAACPPPVAQPLGSLCGLAGPVLARTLLFPGATPAPAAKCARHWESD